MTSFVINADAASRCRIVALENTLLAHVTRNDAKLDETRTFYHSQDFPFMPDFIHRQIHASTGDVVIATARDFYVTIANVCLETEDQCKQNQIADEESETPVFGFEFPETVTVERPTVKFTIPRHGKWFLFYDEDQIGSLDVTIARNRQV